MASIVLGAPPLAAIIFGFQYGVFEDVRRHFFEVAPIKSARSMSWLGYLYTFPPGFRPIYERLDHTAVERSAAPKTTRYLSSHALALDMDALYDDRFPLHLAIYEGDVVATRRILACRPDLASSEALDVAFHYTHFEIATYLMALREHLPPLCVPRVPWTIRGTSTIGQHLPFPCAYSGNVALVRLLRTYTHDGWTKRLLYQVTIDGLAEVAEYLYRHAPETHTSTLFYDAAGSGMLSLVQQMHRDGHPCTADAVYRAIQYGHLDVVRFLCTHGAEHRPRYIVSAAHYKHSHIVAHFLSQVDDDHDVDGALAVALQRGWVDVIELLLASGRTTTMPPDAVVSALRQHHLDVARYLLSAGCQLDAASMNATLLGAYAADPAPLRALLDEFGANVAFDVQ